MGGNVFKNTRRISQENIEPTVQMFMKRLHEELPTLEIRLEDFKYTGSTGKTETSNDIDLILDEKHIKEIHKWGVGLSELEERIKLYKKRSRTASEGEIENRARLTMIAEKINRQFDEIQAKEKGLYKQTLFLTVPIYDKNLEPTGGNVQVDINVGDEKWLEFSHYSKKYEEKNLKGLHRTQLLVSLAVQIGFVFQHHLGVKLAENKEEIEKDPETFIEKLNNKFDTNLTKEISEDYYKLREYIDNQLGYGIRDQIIERYLKILDKTRADIPLDLQKEWREKSKKLELKGKFLPEDSNLKKSR